MTGEPDAHFDPRLTFDTFVVGPANRLASAAARRAAESPGTSFNPLFLYAASGLGKSHILSAIANQSARVHPENEVAYRTLEGYLDELTQALEAGGQSAMRDRYTEMTVLLIDDVQFLAGQPQAQEMLLRTLDTLTGNGAQVVLASDRPPSEINDLDARLLSRFSGGLIVDMGTPDYETRVAILRRKAEERNSTLGEGVAEAMARFPFRNVRELQGALNRIVAIQDLENRDVTRDEIAALLGGDPAPSAPGAVGASTAGPAEPEVEAEPRWRIEVRAAARAAEGAGFEAQRIARLLEETDEPPNWSELLDRFRAGIGRMKEIRSEIDALGNPWPEAAETLLRDPDRIEEVEQLLASARERMRPFPGFGTGPTLADLGGEFPPLAINAAQHLIRDERPDYNPLFVHSPDRDRTRTFLEAVGRSYRVRDPESRVGITSVQDFSNDFIRAISGGVAGAWRERWWSVEVLLVYGIEELSTAERAQEEFFHLFEALKRRTARIILAADRAPATMEGVDERLRSRFEGGLVVDLTGSGAKNSRSAPAEGSGASVAAGGSDDDGPVWSKGDLATVGSATPESTAGSGGASSNGWFPSRDRVVWDWPRIEDRIATEEGLDGD
ncbi:MAG: DnaA/Hda family protein [Gemmatimonadota bacterium]